MTAERRYHLQSEEANRQLDVLLEQLRVPEASWRLYAEMLTSVLKLFEDGAEVADLKITNSALKELRYGFKVFAPYRHVPKVTVFGSARMPAEHPVSRQAYDFGKRMTEAGWMVITGAGSGVMGAAQEGAGRERSFGLNIRLPFEQEANAWIADDPKLITFKYFFTRKLFLVREAQAVAYFPGGFGTCDEAFETLTLVQTGKAALVPIVLVDAPGGTYWRGVRDLVEREMAAAGLISPDDTAIFRMTDDVEAAAAEIEGFYRVLHSKRYVGDQLVVRLRRPLAPDAVADLSARFADILAGPATLAPGPLPAEGDEFPELPRLVLPFTRANFGRLRRLIDQVNQA
ncbi:MAG: TIGR00730 family Rossman fold protein [Candidatus Rokubacteria bacterium]|nr:TIGR00730 family Rossman fold protein [Candidatus Rokubacteria bacterium]